MDGTLSKTWPCWIVAVIQYSRIALGTSTLSAMTSLLGLLILAAEGAAINTTQHKLNE